MLFSLLHIENQKSINDDPLYYTLNITLDNFHFENQNKISEFCLDTAPTEGGAGSAGIVSW